ncbi:hypothetical protein LTR48_003035 [Friedmanniomyces endolithicus]|nr:hypothetical protein LTR94_015058 [Friedmanniomyces endolithicus]KAK0778084.1 hypothetical protein LTR59_013649 [Friedmanniomyces endolithicus]KAK0817625.1 hypothetical protein LTR75_002960 [Friedmanniomyces endolithicus]KAK0833373.1 hypothetical protein LTR03_014809 [Friedmanniomyces endolithicus]KAK0842368.1 hypothetical protein LTS02_016503 [Friedmanniomyces endolithicus]
MGKKASDAKTAPVKKSKATFGASSTTGVVQSKHAFPFDKLPPELRNKIYRLVLVTAEGPIEIIGRLSAENLRVKRLKCICGKTKGASRCERCSLIRATTRNNTVEAKTLATREDGRSRKALMKEAYGGALVSVNRNIHQEAAPILYGENAFAFDNHSVFKRFCYQIWSKRDLLRDITLKGLNLLAHCDAFCILPAECKLQRVKICLPTLDRNLEYVFELLKPLITKPAEQKSAFACIDVSVFDGCSCWGFTGVEGKTASTLLDKFWIVRALGSLAPKAYTGSPHITGCVQEDMGLG